MSIIIIIKSGSWYLELLKRITNEVTLSPLVLPWQPLLTLVSNSGIPIIKTPVLCLRRGPRGATAAGILPGSYDEIFMA